MLLTATPLMFTGIAVAIAFRAGYWNIGVEGQFLVGAVATTALALGLPNLPAVVALPLGFAAGALGGLAWATLPAWLKRHAEIDEVVTTLLLNPVALLVVQGLLNGPWRNSSSGFTDSDRFGPGYDLPALVPDTRVHWGFGIALLLIVVTGYVMARTPTGLRIRAAGQSPKAAAFSGIEVGRLRFRAALVSGSVAGLGGASQVMGVQHQLTQGISNNYGYTGIIVATLGGLSAVGVLLVAVTARRHRGRRRQRLAGPAGAATARRRLRRAAAADGAVGDEPAAVQGAVGRTPYSPCLCGGPGGGDLMSINLLALISATLTIATPLVWASIGEVIIETTGVLTWASRARCTSVRSSGSSSRSAVARPGSVC